MRPILTFFFFRFKVTVVLKWNTEKALLSRQGHVLNIRTPLTSFSILTSVSKFEHKIEAEKATIDIRKIATPLQDLTVGWDVTYVLLKQGKVKYFASRNNQARSNDDTVIPNMI